MRTCVVPPVSTAAPCGCPLRVGEGRGHLIHAVDFELRRHDRLERREVEVLRGDHEPIVALAGERELRAAARARYVHHARRLEPYALAPSLHARGLRETPVAEHLLVDVERVERAAPGEIRDAAARGHGREPVLRVRLEPRSVRGSLARERQLDRVDRDLAAREPARVDREIEPRVFRQPRFAGDHEPFDRELAKREIVSLGAASAVRLGPGARRTRPRRRGRRAARARRDRGCPLARRPRRPGRRATACRRARSGSAPSRARACRDANGCCRRRRRHL